MRVLFLLLAAVTLTAVSMRAGQYQDTERCWEKLYGNTLFELIEERPLAWLPLGILERHGEHLPWGLDGDKAHLVCERLAGGLGGVVLPPNHLAGIHGDRQSGQETDEFRDSHRRAGDFMYSEDYFRTFLLQSFDALANLGFRVIVAYSGHYPEVQTRVLQECAQAYTAECGGQVVVIPFWEPLACGGGDHGAKWESSIWAALVPGGVHLDSIVDYSTGRKGWYRGREIRGEISAEFGNKALEMVGTYLGNAIDKAFKSLGGGEQ